MITHPRPAATIGLMLSGGIDSAALLVALLERGELIQPFYVSTGCVWETDERRSVEKLIDALGGENIAPVVDLHMPVNDLYQQHWSLTGNRVPDQNTTDEAVELPGRNPLLLLKPILWCGEHGISRLAMATLANNPFADASLVFVRSYSDALASATGTKVNVVRPFANMSKAEILAAGYGLALELTFSCLAPKGGLHCGSCNKCAERATALQHLPAGDPTGYANAADAEIRLTPNP